MIRVRVFLFDVYNFTLWWLRCSFDVNLSFNTYSEVPSSLLATVRPIALYLRVTAACCHTTTNYYAVVVHAWFSRRRYSTYIIIRVRSNLNNNQILLYRIIVTTKQINQSKNQVNLTSIYIIIIRHIGFIIIYIQLYTIISNITSVLMKLIKKYLYNMRMDDILI